MYEIDGILYAGTPTNMIKVTGVKPLEDYKLLLTFMTGEKKIFDVKPLLSLPAYEPLKNVIVFENIQLDFDTVTWCEGELDIAPETLYQEGESLPTVKEA